MYAYSLRNIVHIQPTREYRIKSRQLYYEAAVGGVDADDATKSFEIECKVYPYRKYVHLFDIISSSSSSSSSQRPLSSKIIQGHRRLLANSIRY